MFAKKINKMNNYQRMQFSFGNFFAMILLLIILGSQMPVKSNAAPSKPPPSQQLNSSKNIYRFHGSLTHCKKKLINRTHPHSKICTSEKIEQLRFGSDFPWQNPCSGSPYIVTESSARRYVNLAPLKLLLQSMLRTKYGSCKRSDNSNTNWCHKRPKYAFFESSRKTDKLCLFLEHKRLQVYIAGLSFLIGRLLNENRQQPSLTRILENSKTLLCEIETVINQTKCQAVPKALSPKEMCLRLNLESLVNEDSPEVDIIFAKANFGKYLRGLNGTLSAHRHATKCKRPEHVFYDFYSSVVSSTSSRSNQSRLKGRRINRRLSAKPAQTGKARNTARERGSRTERAVKH